MQRLRKSTHPIPADPAPRGVIFDRNGKVLVDSRPIYDVILSREDVKDKDFRALVTPLSDGLGLDADILRDRFDQVSSPARL